MRSVDRNPQAGPLWKREITNKQPLLLHAFKNKAKDTSNSDTGKILDGRESDQETGNGQMLFSTVAKVDQSFHFSLSLALSSAM